MSDSESGSGQVNGQSWLRRTLGDILKRNKRRDVIAAYVGEGARDVVIGKNILNIGTLKIPTAPLLALLAVVVGALVFVALNFAGPAKMDARFNVAVAEIGELGADGQMRRTEDGELFSQWIYDELTAANEDLEDSGVEIWHDSMSLLDKRVKLGRVPGETPEARAEAASELASKIDADVVIYGHVTPPQSQRDGVPGELVLEFYVKPRVRGEANVTIGRYQLGDPIRIPEGFDHTDTLAKEALGSQVTTRASALFQLLLGLREDLLGRSESALSIFRRAETDLPNWREQGEGKEILYFWIGRSALFLNRPDEAEEALENALEIEPNYARSQIVLPGAEFRRIQSILHDSENPLEEEDVRLLNERMGEVIAGYQRGVELARVSHEPLTEFIARLALAGAYRVQAEVFTLLQDDAQANQFFELAINEITPLLEPLAEAEQHRILAQAYQYLGAAHTQQAEIQRKQGDASGSGTSYEQAHQALTSCIDQERKAPEDEILRSAIIADSCVPLKGYVERAQQGLGGE